MMRTPRPGGGASTHVVDLVDSEEDEDAVHPLKENGMCSTCGSVVLPHACVFQSSKVLRVKKAVRQCPKLSSPKVPVEFEDETTGDTSNSSAFTMLSNLLAEHQKLKSSQDGKAYVGNDSKLKLPMVKWLSY